MEGPALASGTHLLSSYTLNNSKTNNWGLKTDLFWFQFYFGFQFPFLLFYDDVLLTPILGKRRVFFISPHFPAGSEHFGTHALSLKENVSEGWRGC